MSQQPIQDKRQVTSDVQGVRNDICLALEKMGMKNPFPIQEETFQNIQDHNDVVAISKNGTGKTLAIAIPALQNINLKYKGIQVIIISNTHENEDQIYFTLQKIIQNLPQESSLKQVVISRKDKRFQNQQTKPAYGQIVVTSIMNSKYLIQKTKAKQIYFDEYDSYYTSRNEEIIREIMQQMIDKEIQGIWLSATPNRFANGIIRDFNIDPIVVNVTENKQMLVGLRQYYAECSEQNRKQIVVQVLKQLKIDQCIIFCNTYQQEELKDYIEEKTQIPTIIIRNDEERKQSYEQFVQRKYRICIASDLISRGLDNRCVNFVINYDLPQSYSKYVQRCGRAGRAGHYAMTLSFVTPKNKEFWLRITDIGRLNIGEDIKPLPSKLNDIDHCWEYEDDEIVF